jgi:hypothetical protein
MSRSGGVLGNEGSETEDFLYTSAALLVSLKKDKKQKDH